MPLWHESWGTWLIVYVVIASFMALSDVQTGLVAIAGLWAIAQLAAVRLAVRVASLPWEISGLLFQITAFGWLAFALAVGLPTIWVVAPAVAVLAIAAIPVRRAERDLLDPIPRYCSESLIIGLFCMLLLVCRFRCGNAYLTSVLISHMAVVSLVLLRNSRLVIAEAQTTRSEDYVEKGYILRLRNMPWPAAIVCAIRLPSGIIGAITVSLELVGAIVPKWL